MTMIPARRPLRVPDPGPDHSPHDRGVGALARVERTALAVRPATRAKSSLRDIALDLTLSLDRSRRDGTWSAPEVVRLFNTGALVQYHAGAGQRASDLCERALALFASRFRARPNACWLGFSLQPFINLARVAGARGRWREAMHIHATLRRQLTGVASGEVPWLDPCVPADMHASWLDAARPTIVEAILVDGVKALMLAGEHRCALAFARDAARDPLFQHPRYAVVVREATARALSALGAYDEAMAVVSEMVDGADDAPWYAGMEIFLAGLCRSCAHPEQARAALERAGAALDGMALREPQGAGIWQLRYVAALEWLALDDDRRALALTAGAMGAAARCGDEAGLIKTMVVCHHLETLRGDRDIDPRLMSLIDATGYRLERAMALVHLGALTPDVRQSRSFLTESLSALGDVDLPAAGPWRDLARGELRRRGILASHRPAVSASSGQQECARLIGDLYDGLMAAEPAL